MTLNELSPGQEDETSLGVDYPTLDAILKLANEEAQSAEEIVAAGYDEALVEHILRSAQAMAFKRALEPPYPELQL